MCLLLHQCVTAEIIHTCCHSLTLTAAEYHTAMCLFPLALVGSGESEKGKTLQLR